MTQILLKFDNIQNIESKFCTGYLRKFQGQNLFM